MTLFVSGLVVLFVFAAAAGISGSSVVAAVAAAGAAMAVAAFGNRFVPSAGAGSSSRGLRVAAAVAAAVALLMLARVTVFIVDPSRPSYSNLPASQWEVHHSCFTAYYVAADIVRRVPNIYDLSLYAVPDDDPQRPRTPRTIGIFRVDQYEYPPPFLLLPRALMVVAPGFFRLRMLWYGLNGLVVLAGLLLVARQLRGDAAARAALLVPFVLASIVTLNTMQKGNVQLAVIAGAMIAMGLVARNRPMAGGALLAFLTLSKLYPGLLVLYLLVRREWRAVGWAAAFSLVLLLVTFADVGSQPFAAFRHQLPGLLSGEAFPAFRNASAVAINYSIPGLVYKLKLFGASGMSFATMQLVGTVYMLLAVAATIVLARRPTRDDLQPLLWLGILILATLRSPFLPQSYAPFPAIWLLTLLCAIAQPTLRNLWLFLGGYLVLNIFIPNDSGIAPRLVALVATLPQALTILLAVVAIRVTALRERTVAGTPAYAPSI